MRPRPPRSRRCRGRRRPRPSPSRRVAAKRRPARAVTRPAGPTRAAGPAAAVPVGVSDRMCRPDARPRAPPARHHGGQRPVRATQHDVPPTEVTKLDNRAPARVEFRDPVRQNDPGDPARLAAPDKPAGLGDDRSRQRQRHRRSRTCWPRAITRFLVQSPLGTEIRDAHSVNGTFVNGVRVGSAMLSEGDVVTIGNIDLVVTGGTLVRRTEAATRTGGLEVQRRSASRRSTASNCWTTSR